MKFGKTRQCGRGLGWLGGLPSLVVVLVVVAVFGVLAPSVALARTLGGEPSGGGFAENPDHTWTLYVGGRVLKVYSAAEKETFDRVWHAMEFDASGQANGEAVTGISGAEAEAAKEIVKRLRTGYPYASQTEREVGEGLIVADEVQGMFEKADRVVVGVMTGETMPDERTTGIAAKIGGKVERAYSLSEWIASGLEGEILGEEYYPGHPTIYHWKWYSKFTIFEGAYEVPCSSLEWVKGSGSEECVELDQPLALIEEVWEPIKEVYVAYETFEAGGFESTAGKLRIKCPDDVPYPSCESMKTGSTETLGMYLNMTNLHKDFREVGFPAEHLGGRIPSVAVTIDKEYAVEPSYEFAAHLAPIAVSNPDVAPVEDEQEIAYALQRTLLPGLEGATIGNPIVPGEAPSEPGQPEHKCGDPVQCASGNLVESQTDLAVGGRGVGLDLTRSYSSQRAAAGEQGIFGYGWSSSFTDHLVLEPGLHLATLTSASGNTVSFTEGSEGSFTSPASSQDKLHGTPESGYTLTLPDQTKYKFSGSSGRLESVTDRDGNETTLTYNEAGQLTTITDPAGRKIKLAYNSEGLVESAEDPMGHVVNYTYEAGNLKSVTQPGEAGLRWQFAYNSEHEMTQMVDGRGGKTTNEYDGYHRVIKQTDPAGHKLHFEYEPLQTKITNESTSSVTLESYNIDGLMSSITHGYGTASATTESFTYNEANYMTSVVDGNKHETKYGYDAEGDRTSATNPDGNETKWEYDSTHDVVSETTPKGETTKIKRESHGNPEVVERPAPESKTQVTKYKYAAHGELESVTNPLEHTWKYEYDSKGDRTAELDPEGNKHTWEYNADSQVTATVSPRGNASGEEPSKFTTKIERDDQGRATKITDPLGHVTEMKYDGDGNVEAVTDGDKHTTKYTYSGDNQVTKEEAPNKALTETEYDGAGEVIAQIDANKHKTRYTRNAVEEVTEVTDPLGHVTKKEYDAAGNLKKIEDPAKRTTTYTYDPANRLTEVSYSSGKPVTIAYEYDKDGDRTKMTDGTGTTIYKYDQLDRLTESENGHKEVIKYEYDLANDQTKITYPNKKAVTRAYDKDGRLEKATDWNSKVITFTYNQDSDLKTTVFPSETKDEDKYTYNDADQMTEVKMDKSTEVLASLVYTRDNDGQVKQTTSKGLPGAEVTENTYDENNRLTKSGSTGYKYDPANNPTTEGATTNTFNEDDELEKGTGASYTYDELGERTKSTPEKGPATTYGYDQAGNLISAERPKEGETSEIKDTYAYNGEKLRTSQTISGTTSYYAWDMTEEPSLILSDGTNSYIYGPGDLPVEQINNSTGTVQYLHHDQQGSTRLLTGSTGIVNGKCTYGAYGTSTCEGTATTPLGYDAQYTSSDTGLIYLRARVYDPKTAQFLTVDPLVASTHEPYLYAGDNPLTYKDRSGLGLEEIFEPPAIPCPECQAAEGAAEALEGAYHAAVRGAEWVNSQLGTEQLGEAAEQGAAAAKSGCELLEKDRTGRVHGQLPRYPDPGWTDEDLEQVAEDLRDSIAQRNQEQAELGEDPEHRNRINEEEQLLRQVEKKLSGS